MRIKTKIDNSEVDKGVKEAEEKINGKKIKSIWEDYEAPEFIDEVSFDAQIEHLEKKIAEVRQMISEPIQFKIGSEEMSQLLSEEEKLTNQLVKLREQQKKYNEEVSKGTKEIEKQSNSHSKQLTNIIKQVGKWTLAIFGVRSAISLISRATSTLSQYNEQLSVDIQYIQYALAKILEPIIIRIVNWVYKLLTYINYLAVRLFDVNLFANASADSFAKAAQSAQEMNDSLTGFDQVNKLSDDTSSSSVTTPSIDLASSFEDVEIPSWLEKLGDWLEEIVDWFKEIYENEGVIGVLTGILAVLGGFFILKSLLNIIQGFNGLGTMFTEIGKGIKNLMTLAGLAAVIESITNLIDTFSESGMTLGEVAGLLGIVLGEVVAAFILLLGALTALNPSWQSVAAAAVIFLGFALVLESVCNLIETFSESGMSLGDVIGLLATILTTIVALMGSVVLLGPSMTTGLAPFSVLVAEICAILIVMAATLPIILDAVADFITTTAPSLCLILTTIGGLIEDLIYALGTVLPPIIESVGNLFEKIFDGIASVINTVGDTLVSILNAIGQLVNTILSSLLSFINQLGPSVETFVDSVCNAVTKLINFIISAIEYLVNTLVIGGINTIISGINAIGKYLGITISTVPEFKIARFTPTYAATGGIVDVPGRGVAVGNNVIAGEAGREGILPLTNANTMRELGEEIGKWVTTNINIVNKMNGRTLSKELIKVQNSNSFARNGG